MLKVELLVNDKLIDEICIWNVSEDYGKGEQLYQVFRDKNMKKVFTIKHKYEDGYLKLVNKVIKKLKDKPKVC